MNFLIQIQGVQDAIAESENQTMNLREYRQELILSAKDSGITEQQIANQLHVSKQRIHQLAHGL